MKKYFISDDFPVYIGSIYDVIENENEIFVQKIYDESIKSLNKNPVIFDIGANIGLFAIRCAVLIENPIVHSFEPILNTFKILKKNMEIYRKDLISITINKAIGATNEEIDMITFVNSSPISCNPNQLPGQIDAIHRYVNDKFSEKTAMEKNKLIHHISKHNVERCQQITISDYIEINNIEFIDMIKLDCEGSELLALNGIIPEHYELIGTFFIEIHDENDRLNIINDIMLKSGFHVHINKCSMYEGNSLCYLYAYK